MCRLSWFYGPGGAGHAPPPELHLGASECAPGLAFAVMVLRANSWICSPSFPRGTHQFSSLLGHGSVNACARMAHLVQIFGVNPIISLILGKVQMGALKWGLNLRPLSAICAQLSTIVHFCGLLGPLSKGNFVTI